MADGIATVVDAVESWLVLLPLILQIPLLLVVLLPVAWGVSWLIDRLVEFGLRRHTLRSEREVDADLAGSGSDAPIIESERTP